MRQNRRRFLDSPILSFSHIRSKRRLRVRLSLGQRTRVTVRAKRRKARTVRRSLTLAAGRRSAVVRLRPGAKAGRYRVSVDMRCNGARERRTGRVRVKR